MAQLKISTVSIDIDDLEKAQILSEHSEKTLKQLFHDYIAMLWELGATYERFNIAYTYYRNTCIIEVTGKNRIGLTSLAGLPKEVREFYENLEKYEDDLPPKKESEKE
jgi:translation initiation factor IF-2